MDFSAHVVKETSNWLVVNKPVNIPVQPDKSGDESLQEYASKYIGEESHMVNRIDRPVSGLVLFAKHAHAQTELREIFARRQVKKYYLAITASRPELDRDKLHHMLYKKERINKSFVADTRTPQVKDAYLVYQYLRSIERYHLLKVRLITGRHHQIRAQLAAIGCPIRGDVKYGYPRPNREHNIQLHSWKLYFRDPFTQEHHWLYGPTPDENIWKAFDIEGLHQEELARHEQRYKSKQQDGC